MAKKREDKPPTEKDLLMETLKILDAEALHKVYLFAKTLSRISQNTTNYKSGR